MPKSAATPGPAIAGTPGAISTSLSETKNTPIADQTAIKIPSTLEIHAVLLFPLRANGAKTARAALRHPHTRIDPIGPSRSIGVLEGSDVRLESPSGQTLAYRRDARSYFPYGRRWFVWDELDLAYFLGYALWNYFALPALLLRDDIRWEEDFEGVLKPRFPAHLPTHGKNQHLIFDRDTGLLHRYDYRPEVVVGGIPLTVGNMVLEHTFSEEGVPYPSKRRVTPIRRDGRILKRPVMVTIEVEDWRLL